MGWDRSAQQRTLRQVTVPARGASEGWSGAGRAVMSAAEWLRVEAGCPGRRCRRAGPGPGGAQDEGQEQHLESDGEAVEVEPGLTYRVEHRDGDVERCNDEVRGAVH